VTVPAEEALTAAFGEEWPRLIAAAYRVVGDLQIAEDVVQETLLVALDRWPLQGVPDRPGAWLMTACRNRARNLVRDSIREQRRSESVRPLMDNPSAGAPGADAPQIADDQLRLMVMCCDPLLPPDSQVALTLRMVGGLTTEEIARAYHLPTAVIAQRVVRAKRVLRQHRVFLGDDAGLQGRLSPVIDVVYLVFNEGYLSANGQALTRGDLAFEARRLACLLTELAPSEADAWALRSLLSFHLSRWATRARADGAPITLEDQDRGRWDTDLIADGRHALEQARHGRRSALVLQAELAACHAVPSTFAATDWKSIVGLYDELMSVQDSPVVALNRAVAVAMADGPTVGLPLLDRLADDEVLRDSHRVWAVRADLHRRAGNRAAAVADYDRALQLVTNQAERQYLAEARLRALNQ